MLVDSLARISDYQTRIEQVLDRCLLLPDSGTARLRDGMRYSVLGGGKRLRPILVYTTGVALGAPLEALDVPAAAVELVHVYSLVHDDLPAMDDDDLRRGRPTCHRAFDEATAILVGDALQALAFDVLANDTSAPAARLEMIRILAHASGTRNSPRKSVTLLAVKTFCISTGQMELASSAPMPRIITLNKPCALDRTSFGKYSSTKI